MPQPASEHTLQHRSESRANNESHTGGTIALARFSAIGDVAMCVPALYSLCRNYPDRRVLMVTRPRLTQIFINPPANLTVLGADVKGEYSGPLGLRRLARRMRDEYGVTTFIDLHNVLRSRILGLWLRAMGVRVSTLVKDRAGRRALTRRSGKTMLPLMSSLARYRQAMAEGGFPVKIDFEGLFEADGGKAPHEAYAALSGPRPEGERWIGIAPFAAHPGKIYPEELMARVVELLASRPAVKIFLFGGGAHEEQVLGAWQAQWPGTVVSLAAKKAGFAAELALMSQLDVMLTMDSANMHLAALTGTRVLSVWGATHAYCGFGGWRQSADDRIEVSLPCRPCSVFGNKPCQRGDMMCMRSIDPQMVADRVVRYI